MAIDERQFAEVKLISMLDILYLTCRLQANPGKHILLLSASIISTITFGTLLVFLYSFHVNFLLEGV